MRALLLRLWWSETAWLTAFVVVMVGGAIAILVVLPGCAGARTAEVDRRLEQSIEALDQARADLGAAEPGSDGSAAAWAEVERLRKEVLELGEARAKALAADTEDAGVDAFWTALVALVAGPGSAVGLNVHRNSTRKVELDRDREALEELRDKVRYLESKVPA